MLKGLALTPPTVGRIAIGKVVERNGKRLPEKDDEFTLTSQVQHRNGWVLHPLDAVLRGEDRGGADDDGHTEGGSRSRKLRSIPVRMVFNDPDLNLRANYSMFDRQTGRPLCVGNGESCKRATASGIQSLPCPSPQGCGLAAEGSCKPYGRLNVRVDVRVDAAMDGAIQEASVSDELGGFVFRTTGFNSIRTLAARLRYFQAVSGGHLATMPLALKLRGKSTTLSHRAPIYYVDLVVRAGLSLEGAVQQAQAESRRLAACGVDQAALDEAARQGLSLGDFEESEEEGAAVVEEFYPAASDPDGEDLPTDGAESLGRAVRGSRRDLGHKLGERLRGSPSGPAKGARTPMRDAGAGTGKGTGMDTETNTDSLSGVGHGSG